ncbi:hypothetical protein FGIG_04607 [Fasciola gigantica]|uniref:Uncharacterized protein n=1 Tax=Fasciola gigantica TaxID=46835 RepID=A0A504YU74_FASGI|nr:hypothetical protein FGIG_04607 [Fasciola gigantica]
MEKVYLTSCSPHYALVKLPNGRTEIVSIHRLAARGDTSVPFIDESPKITPSNDPAQEQSTIDDAIDSLTIYATDDVKTLTDPRDGNLSGLLSRQQRTRAYYLRN